MHKQIQDDLIQRHWLASYGSISHDIDPDAYRFGGGPDGTGHAALRRQARPCRCAGCGADLCRPEPVLARLRRLSAGAARCEEGRPHRGDDPNLLAFPIAFLSASRGPAPSRSTSTRCTRRVSWSTSSTSGPRPSSSTAASPPRWPSAAGTGVKNVITVGVGDNSGSCCPARRSIPRLARAPPMHWPKAPRCRSRRWRWPATTSCSCSTPAAPRPVERRGTVPLQPDRNTGSSRPSCPMR